ncbi:MAG: DUF4922 domain-containing protein [Blastocatellia bacterium]|nr:DUF4922 domain-containing protein [Blastocatellia bacterium]
MSRAWDERLLRDEELALPAADTTWRARVDALFREQSARWPALARGREALAQVLVREVPLGPVTILLQHNPLRLTSTTAAVDDEAVRRRPCFLCPEHLPDEERGLAYGREYVILCNPYPILDKHVTIVHREHIPQALAGRFDVLLDMAAALSPDFFLLYNGPKCGASAPDHLHFQAAVRAPLPIGRNFADQQLVMSAPGITISRTVSYPVPTLIYRATDRQQLCLWIAETLSALADITGSSEEPMLNLIVFAEMAPGDWHVTSTEWTVLVFPRARHRPSCFFAEEPKRLVISPAAIDLAGFVIVPIREHFERVTAQDLERIFSEVALSTEHFDELVARLRARRNFTQI